MIKPICVITGSTGGLGASLAKLAALKGYDLILHGRKENHLRTLRNKIIDSFPHHNVFLITGDLGSTSGALTVARKISEIAPKLDLLINNAGVLLGGIQKSDDGLEMHTQVNLIAPYILMQTLKGNLSSAKGAVINVSSGSAFRAKNLTIEELVSPTKAEKLTGAYARSKLALSYITQELGSEFSDKGITLSSVGPGPNKTNMTTGEGMPSWLLLLRPFIYSSPDKGAKKIFDSLDAAQTYPIPGSFFSGKKVKKLPTLNTSEITSRDIVNFCRSQLPQINHS